MLKNSILHNKFTTSTEISTEKLYDLGVQTFQIPSDDFSYQVVQVTEAFIGRMDLVSKRMYGSTTYSDLLCKLNGISNPFELNDGQILIIPDIQELPKFYYYESESDYNNSSNSSSKESTNSSSKRTTNQAVASDKRFRIDTTNKIIIY